MVSRSQSHQVSIIDDIMVRQGSSFRVPRSALKQVLKLILFTRYPFKKLTEVNWMFAGSSNCILL